jgi:hypothetical protein
MTTNENGPHVRTVLIEVLGGEPGIRTLEPLRAAGFQDRCNRPLCQLSIRRIVI